MKKILMMALAATMLTACSENKPTALAPATDEKGIVLAETGVMYGEPVTETDAIEISALPTFLGDSAEMNAKVQGTVLSVCVKKGCWMNVDMGNGQEVRVSFKDYGFFVPDNIVGKTVVLEGIAKNSFISIEDLRHFAEDAGKSAEEVAKITESKKEIAFEAKGVLVL